MLVRCKTCGKDYDPGREVHQPITQEKNIGAGVLRFANTCLVTAGKVEAPQ